MRAFVRALVALRLSATARWVVVAVLVVLVVGFIVAFLWFVPEMQVRSFSESNKVAPKDVLAQTNEYRRTWAQIIGGFALFLGLYFTWRRVEISQEQQVTERFTRAIDQLGATDDKGKKKLEIRLGAVYALERIARDSKKDHWPIMETLTTYVREHAPWPQKDIQETGFIRPPQTAQTEQQASNKPNDRPDPEIPVPEPDIQAILTVLRRRTRYFGNGEVENLDLHATNLRRGNLRGAHLEGADLIEAHLEKASLWGAHLEGARFLTGEQIEQAIGDETTKLPEGLKRPSSWTSHAGNTYTNEQEDENEQA